MTSHHHTAHTGGSPASRGPARLRLAAPTSPHRATPTPIGVVPVGRRVLVALSALDARQHVHILGPTGTGKSTLLLNYCLSQVRAGRGLAVFDPWGDLARNLLARLPAWAGRRLVLIDPDEQQAPAALNLLDLGHDPEATTDQLVGVMAKVWAQYWGPRTDDLARHAVLTLAHTPNATLADLPVLLTDDRYRRHAIHVAADRLGPVGAATLHNFWDSHHALTDNQAVLQAGPLLARLRAVLSRRFPAGLLGTAASTFRLADILAGGILIVRLPKGTLGDDTVRLVGSLLPAALWQAAAGRANQPEPDRLDAAIVVDECHNFLNLPIGLDHALAEARGLHLSLVLAHQHLGQLSTSMRTAIDANARNKIYFNLSPSDARDLAHHVRPHLTADDLVDRDAYGVVCRLMLAGRPAEPFTLTTRPAPPAIPGRADTLRAAARTRGLSAGERQRLAEARLLARTTIDPGKSPPRNDRHGQRPEADTGGPLPPSPTPPPAG
jgi:hypothetical protein